MDKRYLTMEETATLLQVSKRTIYRWICQGLLPVVRISRTLRIDQVDINNRKEELSDEHED
jgi:excisionase family DNA binding protein